MARDTGLIEIASVSLPLFSLSLSDPSTYIIFRQVNRWGSRLLYLSSASEPLRLVDAILLHFDFHVFFFFFLNNASLQESISFHYFKLRYFSADFWMLQFNFHQHVKFLKWLRFNMHYSYFYKKVSFVKSFFYTLTSVILKICWWNLDFST